MLFTFIAYIRVLITDDKIEKKLTKFVERFVKSTASKMKNEQETLNSSKLNNPLKNSLMNVQQKTRV